MLCHAHIIPNPKIHFKKPETRGHISPAWLKNQEINSYITYLHQNLISHEGLTMGPGTPVAWGDSVLG
jgi:hypothetical protein